MNHLEFAAAESASLDADRAWEDFCDKVEALIERDLDGDEKIDGYSIDGALAAFRRAETPAQYAAQVAENQKKLNGEA